MDWKYLFKHWLTTLALGSLLLILLDGLFELDNLIDTIYLLLFLIVCGFIYSLPTFCLYAVAAFVLNLNHINILWSKLILIVVAICGLLTTFYAISTEMLTSSYAIAYGTSCLLTGLLYKLK